MKISNFTKAFFLSGVALAAGHAVAEAASERFDSIPTRPNQVSSEDRAGHQGRCGNTSEEMAVCCEQMHRQMCQAMADMSMKDMPCHDEQQRDDQAG